MPTEEEIRFNADRIEDDANVLRDAIAVLLQRGSSRSSRVVKDLVTRRDEWQEQADEMRRRAGS